MSYEIQVCVVGFLVICVIESIRRYSSTFRSLKNINGVPLPPGSMGLPFIGEVLSLFATSYSLDLHPFIKTRIHRYGPIFRTSIVSERTIVSADPEVNQYILHQEGKLVEVWYLEAFSKIIGLKDDSEMSSLGAIHRYTRKILLSVFASDNLKQNLLPEIEDLLRNTLSSWSYADQSVEVKRSLQHVLQKFVAKILLGEDAEKISEHLSEIFSDVTDSFISLPLNLPGTTYRRCVKGKEKLFSMLRDMIKEKRERKTRAPARDDDQFLDVLDQLSREMDSQTFITEKFVLHFIYIISFAATDTVIPVILLALKLLEEHPLAIQELKAENESLIKKRKNPDSPLTWDEYKSLTFTHQVINEILRLTNTLPAILRRAVKDIQIKGIVIPAGWTVMLVTSFEHFNSNNFNDPLAFNPWRWKDLDSEVKSKNFMPFGRGVRQCPGAEYVRVIFATFLHVLVTKHRWTKVKGGRVFRNPLIGFGKEGMHVNFSKT